MLQSGELEGGAHVDPCSHDLHHHQIASHQTHHQQWSLGVSLAWLPLESRDELGEGLGDRDSIFDSPDTQSIVDCSSSTHLIALSGEVLIRKQRLGLDQEKKSRKWNTQKVEKQILAEKKLPFLRTYTLCENGEKVPGGMGQFRKGEDLRIVETSLFAPY